MKWTKAHCGLVTSDLVDERFRLGLLTDVGAQLDQALGHGLVSVLAGLLQKAVVQLRVAPHLRQGQAHRPSQLTADRRRQSAKPETTSVLQGNTQSNNRELTGLPLWSGVSSRRCWKMCRSKSSFCRSAAAPGHTSSILRATWKHCRMQDRRQIRGQSDTHLKPVNL